jgi:hypothetical protein
MSEWFKLIFESYQEISYLLNETTNHADFMESWVRTFRIILVHVNLSLSLPYSVQTVNILIETEISTQLKGIISILSLVKT